MTISGVKKLRNKLITACLLLGFVFCRPAGAEVVDRIIANVDDSIITLYDLNRLRRLLTAAYPDEYMIYSRLETEGEKSRFLLEILISNVLIEKEIEKNGLGVKESDIKTAMEDNAARNEMDLEDFIKEISKEGISESDYRDMMKKQIEKMKFFSRFVNSTIMVSDKEVIGYFNENKDKFNDNKKITFSYIVFLKNGPGNSGDMAARFLGRVKNGEPFETVVSDYKDNPQVNYSPDISMKMRELAGDFRDAVSRLGPGDVTGIVENDTGHNIIMIKDTEGVSLEAYKEIIKRKLIDDKGKKAYIAVLNRIWQEHSVEIRY